jgi:hypothetical protein
MAKLTLTDVSNITGNETSAASTINNNSDAIETALENTLSRDGTSPNQMEADLDMNGNDILNVGAITFASGSSGAFGIQGPDSSTDNALVRWDGITGTTIQNSGWTLSDTNSMTAGGNMAMGGNSLTAILNVTFTGASGTLNLNGSKMVGHTESANSVVSSSNVATLDVANNNYFYTTLTENITTVTLSGLPATGKFVSWAWEITQDAGASGYTITWPAAVVWAGGTAPTLTATASAVDVISFWTRDGGTTVYGSVSGQDFS